MRVVLVGLLLSSATLWAAEITASPTQEDSVLSGYQGWSEPVVRDWRDSNQSVNEESTGHTGHEGGMTLPMPAQTPPASQTPAMPHKGMSIPSMKHEGM